MNRWVERGLLVLILLVATAFRLTGIDWDDYNHHHPDERYIAWVATTIEWPSDWATAFDPAKSSFNPFYWSPDAVSKGIEVPKDEPRKFAYGHFPLYLGVAITRLVERVGPSLIPYFPPDWLFTRDILNGAEMVEYRHLSAVTRALTGLIDVGTVWMLFLLGRRLFGPAVGLIAAAFLSLNVMHIQLAHFFAFDPYMTFFSVAAVYFMVLSLEKAKGDSNTRLLFKRLSPATLYLFIAVVCISLAVGSKFAAIMLVLPLLLTIYLVKKERREWFAVMLVGAGFLVFLITNPFAILDLSCEVITPALDIGPISIPALNWGSCFLDNIGTQGAMVRGEVDMPYTRQYSGTLPYLYFIEMQVRWGIGLLLGSLTFIGLGWFCWQGVTWIKDCLGRKQRLEEEPPPVLQYSQSILLTWVIPYLLITGSFFVKFMRYLQPVTPILMLYGAGMLWRWRKGRWAALSLTLVFTGLYALSFVNLYQQPHPWTAASQWIYENVKPEALILSEQWDDALPMSISVNGNPRRRSEYKSDQLTWLTKPGSRDDEEKLNTNLELLAKADYITLASNRIYGVVPRLPDRYPISHQYYPLLFDGSLGYEVVAVYGRFPSLFGYYLKPNSFGFIDLKPPKEVVDYLDNFSGVNGGRVDESFTVYDQPLTIIFENKQRMMAEEMRRLFVLDD